MIRIPPLRHALRAGLLLTGLAVVVPCAHGRDIEVPVETQVQAFGGIWGYDRAHEDRLAGGLVIGVVYQSQVRASLLASEAFADHRSVLEAAFGDVRIVAIDYTGPLDLADRIRGERVDIVYVAPLRAVAVDAIPEVTRTLGVLSTTGVPEYVELGLAMGIELSDGSAGIVINRDAATAEGAHLRSQLLKLARLVGGAP